MQETRELEERVLSQKWYRFVPVSLVILIIISLLLLPMFRQTATVTSIEYAATSRHNEHISTAGEVVSFLDSIEIIQLYRLNGEKITKIEESLPMHCLKLSSDGQVLATHNEIIGIRLYKVADGSLIKEYPGRRCPMLLDHNGATLMARYEDKFSFIRTSDDQILNEIHSENLFVKTNLQLSPDGQLLSIIDANSILFFNTVDGSKRSEESGYFITNEYGYFDYKNIIFSPDSKFIAIKRRCTIMQGCSSPLTELEIRRISDGKVLKYFNYNFGVKNVAFSPDGKRLALTLNHQILIWNLETDSISNEIKRSSFSLFNYFSHPYKSSFSFDERYILINESGRTELRAVDSGEKIKQLGPSYVSDQVFSADGKSFITINDYPAGISFWRIDE